MRSRGWSIVSTAIASVVIIASGLYALAAYGLSERNFVCRGYATSPASSEVVAARGRMQIVEYAPFVQYIASLLRDDMVGEADAVFTSDLTGTVAEHQITASGSPGTRTYGDFSLHRQFAFSEETGQLSIEQAGIVFQGSCLPVAETIRN
jgi:hypothetical protein